MKYEVIVEYKPEVLDPQGRAIQETMNRLGYNEVGAVKVSKRFVVELASTSKQQIEEIAKDFLTNPVSQNYYIKKLSDD